MHINQLAHEKSPYLLQHAHNPVGWYAWGSEAFEKARREDKPIFLSVGYSTCHWCHVMEGESFEDETIAEILNQHFVPVKVDREERPDVDRIYMMFVQATTGSGGWPMSVWLTPELKPFFGGTYFPPDNRHGRPGFAFILERIADAWRNEREKILQSSTQVLNEMQKHAEVSSEASFLDAAPLESGFFTFRRSFDTTFAGFGSAPKFPRPATHNFLVREYARTGNKEALEMVLATLKTMARGGMNDQLGGGFHRYSVDERWFVPHFEKMLYDQAQLAVSYLEAFQITGEGFHAEAARDILEYVLRDMTHEEGGFYSAEDADSVIDPARPNVKGEGAFYVWTQSEIEALLGRPASEWFCYHYGVEQGGNVGNDPLGEFVGKNILFEAHSVEETAQRYHQPLEDVKASLETAKQMLLAARSKRARPHLDDKILTGWNGLMISAFALGSQVLEESSYLEAARRAADFVLSRMHDANAETLLRRYRQGEAAIPGFLDDYAFFTQALLDLYETDFELRYLSTAVRLVEKQLELFEDTKQGAFFSTAASDPNLVMRMKDDYDGAEPSGNSIAVLNLLRLAQITKRKEFRDSAETGLRAFASRLRTASVGVPQMLVGLGYSLSTPKQIILVGHKDAEDTRALLHSLQRRFVPNKIVLLVDSAESRRELSRYLPVIETMTQLDGRATAYVCENYACRLPTADVAQFAELLK
jgi:uncharacterized protein YyaL (SSP411 family)